MIGKQLGRSSQIRILLIEDNAGDQMLVKEGLLGGNTPTGDLIVDVVSDGEEALNYLKGSGRYIGTPRPHLVILDLNLPKKSGLEVLREAKKDTSLSDLPMIVLTTSESKQDLMNCYRAGANCYITKGFHIDKLFAQLASIREFWLNQVSLPQSGPE